MARMNDEALEQALLTLARSWNRLDPELVAPLLAEKVRYVSADTDLHLEGREQVLAHLRRKMELIEEVGEDARLVAELGEVELAARRRPCVIATQGDRRATALFLIALDAKGMIGQVDVATSDPDPARAVSDGRIPG